MKGQRGFILLIALIFIIVLSSGLLSLMQSILLAQKIMNQQKEQEQFFYTVEAQAKRLLSQKTEGFSCFIKERDPNEVLALVKQKKGCVTKNKGHIYYYFIEDLGLYPCLQAEVKGISLGTKHTRITLFASGNYAAFFQMHYASPGIQEPCVFAKNTRISIGLLSWRYLREGEVD